MIWVAWRQQRSQILLSLGLVAVAAVVMVVVRYQAAGFLDSHGVASCWRRVNGCTGNAIDAFSQQFGDYLSNYPLVLLVLPPLLGMFAGAPMFARELEQGTHVFGLTQSVGRVRWWTTKAAVGGVPVVLAMAGLGLLNTWSLRPLRPILTARLMTPRFETEALALGGYTLLAVVIGLTAGLWTRNTLSAMAITLAVYLGVLVGLTNGVRVRYVDPQFTSQPVGSSTPLIPADAWRVGSAYLDADGHELDFSPSTCFQTVGGPTATDGSEEIQACLRAGGVVRVGAWYLPDQRFWALQLIEVGVVGGLSLAGLGLAAYAVRRRLY